MRMSECSSLDSIVLLIRLLLFFYMVERQLALHFMQPGAKYFSEIKTCF